MAIGGIHMKHLYSSLELKNINTRNRLVFPPMCTNKSTDGFANEWHYIHYGTRAVGGVGLIILEATGISPEGRITRDDLGLWDDDHIPMLKRIVDFCHKEGTYMAIQLAHAGRKSSISPSLAPSPIAFSSDYSTPHEMTLDDIKKVKHDFVCAAGRANLAGFDAIELHGAHGYLISEFLSPLTNKREDAYGGSLKNRMRFLLELIREVKTVWPDEKVLMLRVSADAYAQGGNSLEELATIINAAKGEGLDIIDISTGGIVSASVETYPGYQLKHGAYIKEATHMPTLVGGLITNSHLAEDIIRNNRGDLVYMGRELQRNPYFPLTAAKSLDVDYPWPDPYNRAKKVRKFGF